MAGIFSPKAPTTAQQPPAVDTLRIQRSAYGGVVPLVYGVNRVTGNLIWYGDFVATPHTSQQSSGGKGGSSGGGGGTTSYTYSASFALGLCEGPIGGLGTVWDSKSVATPGGATLLGGVGQAPWAYLQGAHPDQALGYSGLAYTGFAHYDLGSSANLPNLSFEVYGLSSGPLAGTLDAIPTAIIGDFLSRSAFPAGYVGDLSLYTTYCIAMGFFISPVLDQAQPANQTLQAWADTTNSAFVWSGGKLNLVPYGDVPVSGHGYAFVPDLTPVYDLADDDFIVTGSEDPITCTRPDLADAYNQFPVEFVNRANQYNIETVTAEDAAHIDVFGIRAAASVQAHHITNAALALQIAQLQMWRQLYVRAQYAFKLGWKHVLLEPMDLVSLTDTGLGLDRTLVRIVSIEEDDTGLLSVTTEEMPGDLAGPAVYPQQAVAGYAADYNAPPPDTNAPIIFDAPAELARAGLEVWIAAAGGAGWGGCDVWISFDDATYKKAGTLHGGARMGVTTIPLSFGGDPDTSGILGVDISAAGGQLLSGTQEDADLLHTLCWVDGEFVSYQTAQLTATGRYNLSYLRRGAYNTPVSPHAQGSKFARLDDAIFKYPYGKEQIGKTVYVKLASFNTFASASQDISVLEPIPYVIQGPPPPPNVTGFTAVQNGNVVVFAWQPVGDYALKGYDIRYAPQGVTAWAAMAPLTDATSGTEMTNAGVPPGTWVFAIRARDVADGLSPQMATQNLVVVNKNDTVAVFAQDPGWVGTLTGFLRHWTGVLVPDSTRAAYLHSNAELFEQFVPYPVATASFETPILDLQFDDTLRVFSTVAAVPGRGATGAPALTFSIDFWPSTRSDPNSFMPWTLGFASLRYLRARITLTTAAARAYLTAFSITADREPSIQSGDTVTIAAGGTAITFPIPYHMVPRVQVTPIGSSAQYASAAAITTEGFTVHVFDAAGSDVGGTVNWDATGA